MEHFPENRSASHKPVLLVADASDELRKILNVALQREGFDVWLASSAQELLEIYRHHREWVDLFLIDTRLPEARSASELLDAVRHIDARARCCFMTDGASDCDQAGLLQEGAAHVFEKPLVLSRLAPALRQLLEHSASFQAA